MFEKIKSVKVKGRCFKDDTHKLDLFPKESHRITVVYGKNGSGKSTISRAFQAFSSGDKNSDVELSLLDYKNSLIKITTSESGFAGSKNHIYIYNEDYISKNVGLKDTGLDTIILLGKQIEVDKKLDVCKETLQNKVNSYNKKHEEYLETESKFNDCNSKLLKELKKKDGWAEIDGKLLSHKKSSSVTDNTIQTIYDSRSLNGLKELQEKYDSLFQKYLSLTTNKKYYPDVQMKITVNNKIEQNLIQLLKMKIIPPKITDDDRELLSHIQNTLTSQLKELKVELEHDLDICGHCYQPISAEYRKVLLNAIGIVLNDDVKSHEKELEKAKLSELSFETEQFCSLNSDICEEINVVLNEINKKIKTYNDYIRQKLESIYNPIEINSLSLNEDLNRLKDNLDLLKEEVKNIMNLFQKLIQ